MQFDPGRNESLDPLGERTFANPRDIEQVVVAFEVAGHSVASKVIQCFEVSEQRGHRHACSGRNLFGCRRSVALEATLEYKIDHGIADRDSATFAPGSSSIDRGRSRR